MEKLAEVKIFECEFTDEIFTQPCQVEDDGAGAANIPAIATFKNLKSLTIFECSLLTDVWINGIVHNTTLEELELVTDLDSSSTTTTATVQQQFTDVGLNAIKETGRIKLTLNSD